jgi:hypothetical protein
MQRKAGPTQSCSRADDGLAVIIQLGFFNEDFHAPVAIGIGSMLNRIDLHQL